MKDKNNKAEIEDVTDDGETEERVTVMRALGNARKAYNKTFEDAGFDSVYFQINIKVFVMDSTFVNVRHMFEDNAMMKR